MANTGLRGSVKGWRYLASIFRQEWEATVSCAYFLITNIFLVQEQNMLILRKNVWNTNKQWAKPFWYCSFSFSHKFTGNRCPTSTFPRQHSVAWESGHTNAEWDLQLLNAPQETKVASHPEGGTEQALWNQLETNRSVSSKCHNSESSKHC